MSIYLIKGVLKMTKFYITNGTHETEKRHILKGADLPIENGMVKVMDELGNGAGWNFEVHQEALIEIPEKDYDTLYNCLLDWSEEDADLHFAITEKYLEEA
jgi:hypothetical protein